jgi:excisionase family DNA binding protein
MSYLSELSAKRDAGKFLTVAEVAGYIHVSERTVRDLCTKGKIGASHPGRKWLIPVESLFEYLKIRS